MAEREREFGTFVWLRDGEHIDAALKRLSKKVTDERILIDLKERQEYRKPSEVRRRKAAAGRSRSQKKQKKMEKILSFLDTHKFPPRKRYNPSINNSNTTGNPNPRPYISKEQREQMANCTLYVGGLPYASTEQDVLAHFAQTAEVTSVKIIKDKETGKSKGYGFVQLTSESDVSVMVTKYNGTDFQGRRIVVNVNRKTESKKPQESKPTAPVQQPASPEMLKSLQDKYSSAKVG